MSFSILLKFSCWRKFFFILVILDIIDIFLVGLFVLILTAVVAVVRVDFIVNEVLFVE